MPKKTVKKTAGQQFRDSVAQTLDPTGPIRSGSHCSIRRARWTCARTSPPRSTAT
jgi:hypothetical protein